MDTTPPMKAADRRPAMSAAARWSSAASRPVRSAAVALCLLLGTLLGAAACHNSKPAPGAGPGTSSPGTNQVQPEQSGSGDAPLPDLGTPFTPSGHPPASLPPLPGNTS